MKESKDELLGLIRNKNPMTDGQLLRLAILLATPAILAQISSVLMQYIDAALGILEQTRLLPSDSYPQAHGSSMDSLWH